MTLLVKRDHLFQDFRDAREQLERPGRRVFFGLFRIGRRRVDDIELHTFGNGYGLAGRVKINGRWRPMPDDLLDKIAVRHIDAAVARTQAAERKKEQAGASVRPQTPASDVPPPLRRTRSSPGALPSAISPMPMASGRASPSSLRSVSTSSVSGRSSPTSYFGGSTTASTPLSMSTAASSQRTLVDEVPPKAPAQAPLSAKWASYCDRMERQTEYGGEPEIIALSRILQRPVVVVSRLYGEPADSDAKTPTPDAWDVSSPYSDDADAQAKPLYLLLQQSRHDINKGHYEPLHIDKLPQGAIDPSYIAQNKSTVLGDGSCLFHSVAKLINDRADKLRLKTVQWLRDNGEKPWAGQTSLAALFEEDL